MFVVDAVERNRSKQWDTVRIGAFSETLVGTDFEPVSGGATAIFEVNVGGRRGVKLTTRTALEELVDAAFRSADYRALFTSSRSKPNKGILFSSAKLF